MQRLGFPVEPYFRPSEERRATENSPFMTHRLAAIDVMIAADLLCAQDPSITCPRMLSERELKRDALRVQVPSLMSGQIHDVAVIPDAWFQLEHESSRTFSIALELDRGTEDQKVWRAKIAAYLAWATGPYMQAFETDNITVAVVCSDHRRVGQLIDWTMREITARRSEKLAELFLFTDASPVKTPVQTFFSGHIWFQADTGEVVSLLDFPMTTSESGVVFQAA
jgi:Replication-relaxation